MLFFLKRFSFFYSLIVISDLIVGVQWPEFRWISKPLILISLILYFVGSTKNCFQQELIFLLALIAALIGDILLLRKEWFLFGLAAFLVMQILYSLRFIKDWPGYRGPKFGPVVLVLTIFTASAILLWPHLADMIIPVLIYSGALCFMSLSSFFRAEFLPSRLEVFVGAFLFLVSDFLIGVSHFIGDFSFASILIMISYSLAQFLIVSGIVNQVRERKDR